MKNKILLFIFSICVAISIGVTNSVFAETHGDLTYTISNGEITITGCNTSVTNIEIPATINGYPVTKIGSNAFKNHSNVTNVSIANGVAEIGDMAFTNCNNMISVEIPPSINKIGAIAFEGCPALKSVYISNIESWCNIDFSFTSSNPLCNGCKLYLNGILVTSLTLTDSATKIAPKAFYNYTYLEEISIPSSVISVGGNAFYNTTWMNNQDDGVVYVGSTAYIYKGEMPINEEIVLKEGTTSIADNAFKDFQNLLSVNLPSSVTYIGSGAFNGCSNLAECILPSNLTYIGSSAFEGCSNLTTITIPDSVTEIGTYVFGYCTSLTNVKMSENLIWVPHGTFYRCISLKHINIPQKATIIGTMAFSGCSLIESINMPLEMSVIYDDSFSECAIKEIHINSIESWCQIDFISGWDSVRVFNDYDLYLNGNIVTSVEIPSSINVIKRYAFCGCNSIKNVALSRNTTSIEYGAFFNCKSLDTITISENLLSVGNCAFYNSGIKKIYYGGYINDWEQINIGDYNTPLTNADIYYHFREAYTETKISDDKKIFSISQNNINVGDVIILALYNETEMVDVHVVVCDGNNITYTTNVTYDMAKIMVWESMNTLTPLSNVEEIKVQ